jgi:hypothetical protein
MKKQLFTGAAYSLLFLLAAFGFTACKKLPDGFISNLIRYEEEPIVIQKGRVKVSSALNLDGSTKPAKVRVLHFYNKATGAIVDSIFNKKYKIKAWKGLYDPATDTTLALIEAKQYDIETTPIVINEASGQVEANYTTINLPVGEYEFDLEISNAAGTRVYNRVGKINLIDAPPYETSGLYVRMIKVGNESQGTSLTSGISVTVNRVADAPNQVTLKFVDKNGVAFNPQAGEVQRRPFLPTRPFLQSLEEYAMSWTHFNDRIEAKYGVVPFPLNSLGNAYLWYYRIPAQYFSHDNQVAYPNDQWSANPRVQCRIFVPGSYTIEFKYNNFIHR